MPTITTTDGVDIFFKDWGSGQPIVFSHGWPLSADDWDNQMLFFLGHGYRVIAADRRGHGRSTPSRRRPRRRPLRRRPARRRRTPRPARRHTRRTLHRRRRSYPVSWAAAVKRRAAKAALISAVPPLMVQTADESRRLAQESCSTICRPSWQRTAPSSTAICLGPLLRFQPPRCRTKTSHTVCPPRTPTPSTLTF